MKRVGDHLNRRDYHNAWIAHLLETKGIQGAIGYRRHTHKGAHYGKYRFRYDPIRDEYICPEKQRLTWKTTTREGYRQYCCDARTCKGCARRTECFGASMSRKVVERHVWQEGLERVDAFTKTHRGKRIYGWRKETIERSFAEAKENHGLRYARMLGIRNMREQCFLTAAVQNIKRLVASLLHVRANPKFCVNPISGANRAEFIRGGSRLVRLPPCLHHNADGGGCQGRRSRSFHP